jgi:NhaA family Na+:H+ antiporter
MVCLGDVQRSACTTVASDETVNDVAKQTGTWADTTAGATRGVGALRAFARRARGPIDRFLEIEASSGLLLVAVAAVAVVWANSPWRASYAALWETPVGVRVGSVAFERSLQWVVNDVLMVVFFFVVGLEIRREIHEGELSEWRRAALPVIAAIGGMIVPALIYMAIAGSPPTASGWGVPMATDIAFAVGILSILGTRVPAALRVLLLSLAVIDDLGATIVVAIFYSGGIEWGGIGFAVAALGAIAVMQRAGVRSSLAYVPPTVMAWVGTYGAGVHPTIAGVAVGLLTPVQAWLHPSDLRREARRVIDRLRSPGLSASPQDVRQSVRNLSHAVVEVRSPVARHVETLHPWVAYGVMPIFALANAGVSIDVSDLGGSAVRVVGGVAAGLVIGKPVGIALACVAATRAGIAQLPVGIGVREVMVLGCVAGIGFTMALFVGQLAFADAHLLAATKVGILGASVVAALAGLGLGWTVLGSTATEGEASTANQAEQSTEA